MEYLGRGTSRAAVVLGRRLFVRNDVYPHWIHRGLRTL